MSNLHAPTIPSGPTSAPIVNGNAAKLSIAEFQRKKDAVEGELRALGGVLESHGVDMNTSLLTSDGFPRADIDVAQIRTTRARIIHLRNDWKDLMAVIEKRLHEHFSSLGDEVDGTNTAPAAANADMSIPRDSVPEMLDRAFAKVNTVVENSPAAIAGLKPGDLIRNFGYVNHENHENLRRVGECVQGNEGVSSPQYSFRLFPSHCQVAKLTSFPAKYFGKSITDFWGYLNPRAPADIDTATGLGREGPAWVPYLASVIMKRESLLFMESKGRALKLNNNCAGSWAPDVWAKNRALWGRSDSQPKSELEDYIGCIFRRLGTR